jgi:hypothetical protein
MLTTPGLTILSLPFGERFQIVGPSVALILLHLERRCNSAMEYLCARDHAEPGGPPIARRRPFTGMRARRSGFEDRGRLAAKPN